MKKKTAFAALFCFLAFLGGASAGPQSPDLFAILQKSNQSYGLVKNYSAIFEKQERSQGKLGEKEKIFLKFEKPFKIFMGWLNTEKKDLQVVYERGHHQGKLAIHKPGLFLLPVIFLDQNSPWVHAGSEKYDIEDAGIGTFLTDFTKQVDRARKENKLQVVYPQPDSAAETVVEVTFTGSTPDSGYMAYRVIVSFDKATSLPVRMSLYDWKGELTGSYSYENLRLNVPSDEEEFTKQINRQLYRVYREK